MIDLNKIPNKGYVLAYFNKDIQFEPYYVDQNGIHMDGIELWKEEPKECHFFNEEKEYRKLITNEGVKELLLTKESEDKMDKECLFTQKVYLKEKYSTKKGKDRDKLIIVNHFDFNDDDIIYLKDYRLAGVEK